MGRETEGQDGSDGIGSKLGEACWQSTSFMLFVLLVTKGIATRNKDATRGSWPYY